MEFITRTLQSDPGLSQKEALLSLQNHPTYKAGTMIASVRRRKNVWVAELLEPKTAEFPPKSEDGGDEGGEELAPPKSDGPPAPGGSDPDGDGDDDSSVSGDTDKDGAGAPGGDKPGGDKPGKGGTETAILHTLQQILHALQGGGAPEGLGGPDALGPGAGAGDGPPPPGPAGPPPPGGPGGPPGKGGKPGLFGGPKAMKPGDTPPGGTPVGAPAFASTKQANPSLPPAGGVAPAQGTPVPTGQAAGPTAGGTCPVCGGPEPCPMHGGGALNQAVAAYSQKAATINLSTEGTDVSKAVSEARPVLAQYGYTVKQAKKGAGRIHILASRR